MTTERPALELRIHKRQNCGMPCDCIVYVEPSDPGLGLREDWVDDRAERKRLTDPEAAAEYWYELSDTAPVDLDREDKVDAGELEPLPYILERFATLPHAASTNYE